MAHQSQMLVTALTLLASLSHFQNVAADSLLVSWANTPGARVSNFTGSMIMPYNIPADSDVSFWPGLCPTSSNEPKQGVLQPVVEPRPGGWATYPIWCCDPGNVDLGGPDDPTNVTTGEEVLFSLTQTKYRWEVTVGVDAGSDPFSQTTYWDHTENLAWPQLVVESGPWNFGYVIWNNVNFTIYNPQSTDVCEPSDVRNITWSRAGQQVTHNADGSTTCFWERIVLWGPSAGAKEVPMRAAPYPSAADNSAILNITNDKDAKSAYSSAHVDVNATVAPALAQISSPGSTIGTSSFSMPSATYPAQLSATASTTTSSKTGSSTKTGSPTTSASARPTSGAAGASTAGMPAILVAVGLHLFALAAMPWRLTLS